MRLRDGRCDNAGLRRILGAALLCLLAACRPTEIVLYASSNLPLARLGAVDIVVETAHQTQHRCACLAPGCATSDAVAVRWPITLGLRPEEEPGEAFTVRLEGHMGTACGDAPILEQLARVRFRDRARVLLRMGLDAACLGVSCRDADQTCNRGVCVPIDFYVDELGDDPPLGPSDPVKVEQGQVGPPSIAHRASDGYVVTWTQPDAQLGAAAWARSFDDLGVAGSATRISGAGTAPRLEARVAIGALPDNYLAAWPLGTVGAAYAGFSPAGATGPASVFEQVEVTEVLLAPFGSLDRLGTLGTRAYLVTPDVPPSAQINLWHFNPDATLIGSGGRIGGFDAGWFAVSGTQRSNAYWGTSNGLLRYDSTPDPPRFYYFGPERLPVGIGAAASDEVDDVAVVGDGHSPLALVSVTVAEPVPPFVPAVYLAGTEGTHAAVLAREPGGFVLGYLTDAGLYELPLQHTTIRVVPVGAARLVRAARAPGTIDAVALAVGDGIGTGRYAYRERDPNSGELTIWTVPRP